MRRSLLWLVLAVTLLLPGSGIAQRPAAPLPTFPTESSKRDSTAPPIRSSGSTCRPAFIISKGSGGMARQRAGLTSAKPKRIRPVTAQPVTGNDRLSSRFPRCLIDVHAGFGG